MIQTISKPPNITPEFIQFLLSDDSSPLEHSDDLTKYIVAKCLSNNKTEEPSLTEYLNGLKEKQAYKYFYSNLLFEPRSYLLSLKNNNSHIRLIDNESLPIKEMIPFTFSDENIQIKDLFSTSRIIVGAPGAGKSTLLK